LYNADGRPWTFAATGRLINRGPSLGADLPEARSFGQSHPIDRKARGFLGRMQGEITISGDLLEPVLSPGRIYDLTLVTADDKLFELSRRFPGPSSFGCRDRPAQ
jgi:hypothetical protein